MAPVAKKQGVAKKRPTVKKSEKVVTYGKRFDPDIIDKKLLAAVGKVVKAKEIVDDVKKVDYKRLILRDWRFWMITVILVAALVLMILSSGMSDGQTIDQKAKADAVKADAQQQEDLEAAKTHITSEDFKNVSIDAIGLPGAWIVEWIDLLVMLIVLGFIIGVFVKIGGLFK